MTNKERKRYIVNRCYSAHYAKLPEAFKQINILRYPGLWISILSNTELYNIQNLTPECTDVLLNTEGGYNANYENLEYTLQVFYELNYFMEKLRFVGNDVFAYPDFVKAVKLMLRLPKIRRIDIVCSGDTVPAGEQIDVLRNPGMTAIIDSKSPVAAELEQLFTEREVNFELREIDDKCTYCKNTHTIFVEGKIFRCPLSAEAYADGIEVPENSYVDIVARKLQIKALRLAIFDITNDPPPENCKACDRFSAQN